MDTADSTAQHYQHQESEMIMHPPLNPYTLQFENNNNFDSSPPPLIHNEYPLNSSGLKPLESINSHYSGFSIERKKRGRPRKYDNNIASSSITPVPVVAAVGDSGATPASEFSKKGRGRPPGSGKKQLDALGTYGVGFTPHVIVIKPGEDVASKIMAFSQQGPRTVCILSAHGAICNVTLRQPAMSGCTVTYEGRFEIISLSGSLCMSDSNDNNQTCCLSVSLAGADGRVLGGGVAGALVAATPVQVIVGSFIADGKKPKSGLSPAPPPHMLNFGAQVPGVAPPSEGGSSDSSDESGSSPFNHHPGSYSNASQPMPPMYADMNWANSTTNILPN
ncbi:AT-hook motif nuclear-localized protein [Heracleum sosnowskyi]|uniref:AT-hook motif nuclear-localized protein n=1 Tax=Heracleum sosnowskyi TaxID=360622 RepID=A0AAD8I616_9APIA|nr:AT-hook motif nuclear-localized protein [Heracleum sosnowskyi]